MAYWKVREIAEPERWNAKSLAEASGLAYGTVYNIWVNRSTQANLETLTKLASVLKVEPGDLIGKKSDDNGKK